MTQLLSTQQSILRNYKDNIVIGLDLIQHKNEYNYSDILKRLAEKNIREEPFPYEIVKAIPVSILPEEKASQISVRMLVMKKSLSVNLSYYHIISRWYIIVDKAAKRVSAWTSHVDYTQDFLDDINYVAIRFFKFFTGSTLFYPSYVRIKIMSQLIKVLNDQVEKILPLSLEDMRGGKIFPLRPSNSYYSISSLPLGKRCFIFIDSTGFYTIEYKNDLLNAAMNLTGHDISYFDSNTFPLILTGYEINKLSRNNGGKGIKNKLYVINDCLTFGGASLVNAPLNDRIGYRDAVITSLDRENEEFSFIGQMQMQSKTPRGLFELLQQVLSKRNSLFYLSDGIFFQQSRGYARQNSYEWKKEFTEENFLGMNTNLLASYHEKEKKYLLDYPPSSLKKSMSLLDLSSTSDPTFWGSYYQIFTFNRGKTKNKRVIEINSLDDVKKVDVIYAEHLKEEDFATIREKLNKGGYLILKIAEKELIKASFIVYSQYDNKISLPDSSLGEITLEGVKIGDNSYRSTSIKDIIAGLKFDIILNYILDKEIILNSTEEMLTRMFSGVILRYGDDELKDLHPPLKVEVKIEEVITEKVNIPDVNLPREPTIPIVESATPEIIFPNSFTDDLRKITPITRTPGYKPTTIKVSTGKSPKISISIPKEKEEKKTSSIIKCKSLKPGDKINQWNIKDEVVKRLGTIGDGSCLIHAISRVDNDDYPRLDKSENLQEDIQLAKEIIIKERKDLAKNFTLDEYNKYEFKNLGEEYSYKKLYNTLKMPSEFIGHELIPYISDYYNLNILFITCAKDKETYEIYREGRNFEDYPKDRFWIIILWVDENHFETIGLVKNGKVNYLIADSDRIAKLFDN